MPLFYYKVRDSAGKILEGQMEAQSGSDLRHKLDEQGYFIVDFSQARKKETLADQLPVFGRKVTLTDLAVFCWQLYTMLDAGLTLTNSLRIIIRQAKNVDLKHALTEACSRVEEGTSFSEGLKEHPKVFSPLFIHMVSAGEVGGVLDEMLKKLALYYEEQETIRSRLSSAMIYPALLITLSGSVVIFLLSFILPRFAKMFDRLGADIPTITRVMINFGELLRNYWYGFLLIPVGIYALIKFLTRNEAGRVRFDRLRLRVPMVGPLITKTLAARFTQMLSTLISAGIPIMIALEVVTDAVENEAMRKVLREVTARVGEGKTIAEPLEKSRIFPDMVVSMVQAGEETGALDKMLDKIAFFYHREVNNAIETFTKLIEPILIVIITCVVGFIALSIFLPMADILQSIH